MFTILKTFFITLLALLGLVQGEADRAPIDTSNGGDPVLIEDAGNTYYTFTTGGGVDICKIESIDNTTVTDRKTVFYAGRNGTVKDVWAPEIHKIGDRWYILSCALFSEEAAGKGSMPNAEEYTEHDDWYRYGFVLESKTEDVFGEYEFKGILAPDGMNNIDGTYLQKDGKLYYVCSAYTNIAEQNIYICEMENPYTLKVNEDGSNGAVRLSRPFYKWEKQGWSVNEGPAVLYNGDDIFIVYSASGFSSGSYCMGMLTLTGNNVMNPLHWYKSPIPVHNHRPEAGIFNAGHCSFLYREDGSIYMVYHATANADFHASPRLTHIKPVAFVMGVPVF